MIELDTRLSINGIVELVLVFMFSVCNFEMEVILRVIFKLRNAVL